MSALEYSQGVSAKWLTRDQCIANLLLSVWLCVSEENFENRSIFDEVMMIWNMVAYCYGPPSRPMSFDYTV